MCSHVLARRAPAVVSFPIRPTDARRAFSSAVKIHPASATPAKTALKSQSRPRHALKPRQNESHRREMHFDAIKTAAAAATFVLTPLKSTSRPRHAFLPRQNPSRSRGTHFDGVKMSVAGNFFVLTAQKQVSYDCKPVAAVSDRRFLIYDNNSAVGDRRYSLAVARP